MAFQVNTNINALNSVAQATFTQTSLASSLQKISSGLRINSAKDDASGMAIADTLRAQANALGQAIRNGNDGMNIIQIADKAMDEQVKILDTIKTKAIQAAQDGQTEQTRKAIQADITRLIESLDNIAATTSYNGLSLLAGGYTNKEFQIGAFSNQTIRASIGATSSDKIGHVRTESYMGASAAAEDTNLLDEVTLKFTVGAKEVTLESVTISTSAGTGLGVLAEAINRYSDELGGVRATAEVVQQMSQAVAAGTIEGLKINGVLIGTVTDIKANDKDNRLVQAINAFKDQTGVEASIGRDGRLILTSIDGRAIQLNSGDVTNSAGTASSLSGLIGITSGNFVGRLQLTQLGANDILVDGLSSVFGELTAGGVGKATNQFEAVTTLRKLRGTFDDQTLLSLGVREADINTYGAGVTSFAGAQLVVDIAESAIKQLDSIRSDLGSVQQQMQSTINNITITQVNVKSAESGIREVDFASESANFTNLNILAQAGSYAMSQANATQQNILRLLQ